jgi:hypothetical protein
VGVGGCLICSPEDLLDKNVNYTHIMIKFLRGISIKKKRLLSHPGRNCPALIISLAGHNIFISEKNRYLSLLGSPMKALEKKG